MAANHKPSMLNFTASIEPSKFLMYAAEGMDADTLLPLTIERMTVRGTIGNDMKNPDEQKAAKPNIQRVDVCHLPAGTDTLVVSGTVKLLANSLQPNGINETKIKPKEVSFIQAHQDFIEGFRTIGGFRALAERYLMNLLNGRCLWRNGAEALDFRCSVACEGLERLSVERADIDPADRLALSGIRSDALRDLAGKYADAMAKSFSEKGAPPLLMDVELRAVMGPSQPVYPSQEFIEAVRTGADDGKVLAKTPVRHDGDIIQQAFLHPQKVGNAIRTIDTWYAEDASFPIAVEPWGVHQSEQKAYRLKNGLYAYLGKLEEYTDRKSTRLNSSHYS